MSGDNGGKGTITQKLKAAKDMVLAATTPALGRAYELPIINPLLLRAYPQKINYSVFSKKIEYTVSSEYLDAAKTYPRGDARNYVGDMLNALSQPSQEKILPEFVSDLPRFNIVEIKKVDGSISNNLTKDEMQEQQDIGIDRSVAVENFLTYVVSEAHMAGKNWVDKDKLRPIISYLSQPLAGRAMEVLSSNLYIERTTQQQKSVMPVYVPINKNRYLDPQKIANPSKLDSPFDLTLTIDGEKILLSYQIYISCHPSQPDAEEAKMDCKLVRELKLNIDTMIDFSLLSQDAGKIIPGSAAVTQHIMIESLTDEICFANSVQLADLMKHNTPENSLLSGVDDNKSETTEGLAAETKNLSLEGKICPSVFIKVNNLPITFTTPEILDRANIKYAVEAVRKNASKEEIDYSSYDQFIGDLSRFSMVVENGDYVMFEGQNVDAHSEQSIQVQMLDAWVDYIKSIKSNELSSVKIKNIITAFNQRSPIALLDFFEKLTNGYKDCTLNGIPMDFFSVLQNYIISELQLNGSVLSLSYVCPMHAFFNDPDIRDPNNRDIDLMIVSKLTCDFSKSISDEDFVSQQVTIVKVNLDISVNINKAIIEPPNGSVTYGKTNLENVSLVFEGSQADVVQWSKNNSLRATLGKLYTGVSSILKSDSGSKTTLYSPTGFHRSASQYSLSSSSATMTPSPLPDNDLPDEIETVNGNKIVKKNLLTLQFKTLDEQSEPLQGDTIMPDIKPTTPTNKGNS
jgi:hypothetical protein